MTAESQFKEALEKHLPEGCSERIYGWLIDSQATLRITKARKTKLGDYRAPHNEQGHRISINHNLNPYSFLITLVHEIAHMHTWSNHERAAKPHGREWKMEYKRLMTPFLDQTVFPEDIDQTLRHYMTNPAASSCTHLPLLRVLKKYDPESDFVVLEELAINTLFCIDNKRLFQKGEKLRKRFKCKELHSRRYYLISPLAEVRIVDK